MLEELKNIKSIGNNKDILFFLQKIIGQKSLSLKEMRIVSRYTSGRYLNVESLLKYCLLLNLVTKDEEIRLSSEISPFVQDDNMVTNYIIDKTVSVLFNNKIFNEDLFYYDVVNKRFAFLNDNFPLKYSEIRNILIDQGFLEIYRGELKRIYLISSRFESLVAKHCKKKKRLMGINQLKKMIQDNNEAGEKAELWALEFEKKRIKKPQLVNQIKIISDIDVCAGYDIVSFNSEASTYQDFYIEVKAVAKSITFFWSLNEIETAKLKGDQYCLYLVELNNIENENYSPIIIKNAYEEVFNSNDWQVEGQTYKIQQI